MFNNDISKISHQLQIYKKYLNSNAIVRLILEKYQTSDLKIQWVLTSRTVIEPANDDDDILPVKFNYTEFSDLVNFIDDKQKSVGQLHHCNFFIYSPVMLLFSNCYCIVLHQMFLVQLFSHQMSNISTKMEKIQWFKSLSLLTKSKFFLTHFFLII